MGTNQRKEETMKLKCGCPANCTDLSKSKNRKLFLNCIMRPIGLDGSKPTGMKPIVEILEVN